MDRGALLAGRFRVEGHLGQGGAASVYRVCDERTGKHLALKQLCTREGSDPAIHTALFEREYHTLCQLAHPRIIEVYDYGVDVDGAFYTMELLDGLDLQTSGVLHWRRACELLSEIASSLAIVHSRRLVHRDISARNVRCTSDGRAKLLDFGALAPMGVAKQVVGTPPYLAPEALERQGLDGRVDLYSLGALAYWVLTGYHAYHARSVSQVRNLWRSPPLPVTQYQPGIPAALDQLVMELLQLERTSRPNTAAEVMERLSVIGGLPLAELPQVKRSYLVMPNLVARDAPLQEVRQSLQRMLESRRGGSLLIEGDAGTGRSRMLEACVLEGRLLGMWVARSDASDGGATDYGTIRSLCEQLWELAPELAEQLSQPDAATLASVLPAGRGGSLPDAEPSPLPATPSARKKLLAALQRLLIALARTKPLLIAIDDLDAVDEPSAALCGMLANAARQQPLVIVATHRADRTASPGLSLVKQLAVPIAIGALDVEQSEALLRSVFGDVDHVAALAERVHGVALGNVRSTMTLVEHLVERDLARYEAGSWSLRPQLGAQDLPESMSAELLSRVTRVGGDARQLAEALALTDPLALSIDRYALLTDDHDTGRCHAAAMELVAAMILVPSGERFRFAQADLVAMLRSGLTAGRERELHGRIGVALVGSEDPYSRIHHLLQGGNEREALELLQPLLHTAGWRTSGQLAPLMERAAEAAVGSGLPLATQLLLQSFLLLCCAHTGDAARFERYGPALLHRLTLACGLSPPGADGSPPPFVTGPSICLDAAQPLALERAADLLGRVCVAYATMASVAKAPELFARVPTLAPIGHISPLLRALHFTVEMSRALSSGGYVRGLQYARECLEQSERPETRAENADLAESLADGMRYTLALYDATLGSGRTGEWLIRLQQQPGIRANAARLRMVYELMHGNAAGADAQRRRAELLALQDGALNVYPHTTERIELLAYVFSDNLTGVKRTLERIEAIAAMHPGWRSTLSIGRAHHRRLQGDLHAALAELEPALACCAHGHDLDWAWAAGTHIALTTALKRHPEALELAVRYLAMDERTRFVLSQAPFTFAICEALANGGRAEQALILVERFIAAHRSIGARGLRLGLAYETAARIAMRMNDEAAFNDYAALCAQEYRGGRDLLLKAKHERLLREAEESAAHATLA